MVTETIANRGRLPQILLIEDNFGDVILTKKAFKAGKLAANIKTAEDGQAALDLLQCPDISLPDLILLDLNLPKMSGIDVLKSIKSHPVLRRIPVIVMTSSRAASDVINVYDHQANAYILKPASLESFANAVSAIEQFWFSHVMYADYQSDRKV